MAKTRPCPKKAGGDCKRAILATLLAMLLAAPGCRRETPPAVAPSNTGGDPAPQAKVAPPPPKRAAVKLVWDDARERRLSQEREQRIAKQAALELEWLPALQKASGPGKAPKSGFQILGLNRPGYGSAFSPADPLVMSTHGGTKFLFDLKEAKPVGLILKDYNLGDELRFSPDGRWFLTRDRDGVQVQQWNTAERKVVHRYPPDAYTDEKGPPAGAKFAHRIIGFSFTPDSDAVLIATRDKSAGAQGFSLQRWSTASGKRTSEKPFAAGQPAPDRVEFAPDGAKLAAVTNLEKKANPPAEVEILSTEDGALHLSRILGGPIRFSPDSWRLAIFTPDAAGVSGQIRVWDLKTDELREVAQPKTQSANLLFSPDGKHLYYTEIPGGVVMDLSTLTKQQFFPRPVAVSPGGQFVMADDGRLWETGKLPERK